MAIYPPRNRRRSGARARRDDPARDRRRARQVRRRPGRRQARRRHRAAQPHAPPEAPARSRRRDHAQKHHHDRPHRRRQNRDRPAPRQAHQLARSSRSRPRSSPRSAMSAATSNPSSATWSRSRSTWSAKRSLEEVEDKAELSRRRAPHRPARPAHTRQPSADVTAANAAAATQEPGTNVIQLPAIDGHHRTPTSFAPQPMALPATSARPDEPPPRRLTREKLRQQFREGKLDDRMVELDVRERNSAPPSSIITSPTARRRDGVWATSRTCSPASSASAPKSAR